MHAFKRKKMDMQARSCTDTCTELLRSARASALTHMDSRMRMHVQVLAQAYFAHACTVRARTHTHTHARILTSVLGWGFGCWKGGALAVGISAIAMLWRILSPHVAPSSEIQVMKQALPAKVRARMHTISSVAELEPVIDPAVGYFDQFD